MFEIPAFWLKSPMIPDGRHDIKLRFFKKTSRLPRKVSLQTSVMRVLPIIQFFKLVRLMTDSARNMVRETTLIHIRLGGDIL